MTVIIGTKVRKYLPPYLQRLADNLSFLRISKEAAESDIGAVEDSRLNFAAWVLLPLYTVLIPYALASGINSWMNLPYHKSSAWAYR